MCIRSSRRITGERRTEIVVHKHWTSVSVLNLWTLIRFSLPFLFSGLLFHHLRDLMCVCVLQLCACLDCCCRTFQLFACLFDHYSVTDVHILCAYTLRGKAMQSRRRKPPSWAHLASGWQHNPIHGRDHDPILPDGFLNTFPAFFWSGAVINNELFLGYL